MMENNLPTPKRPKVSEVTPVSMYDAAKLNEIDLSFSLDFDGSSDTILVEVTDSILSDLAVDIPSGRVQFIGDENSEAVMLTSGESFRLSRVETSNKILLISPLAGNSHSECIDVQNSLDDGCLPTRLDEYYIKDSLAFQYELIKKFPDLELLKKCLSQYPYKGKDYEISYEFNARQLTLEDLQEKTQVSMTELMDGLKTLGALLLDTRWRMLDEDLVIRTTNTILSIVLEQELCLSAFDSSVVISAAEIDGSEYVVAKHCLGLLTYETDVKGQKSRDVEDSKSCMTALDMKKVHIFKAHLLFQQYRVEKGSKSWPKNDFLSAWEASIPDLSVPDEELLKGIAILEVAVDGPTKNESYRYVPAMAMPTNPKDRLSKLFAIKPKWPLDELKPYLDPLCGPGLQVADLLVKYTRISTDPKSSVQMYSSR